MIASVVVEVNKEFRCHLGISWGEESHRVHGP